jgi:hypothetical protein
VFKGKKKSYWDGKNSLNKNVSNIYQVCFLKTEWPLHFSYNCAVDEQGLNPKPTTLISRKMTVWENTAELNIYWCIAAPHTTCCTLG